MKSYDVVVVGGGHAGIEAALAAGRLGCSVCLISFDSGRIGEMSCNPAIGGIAKGTLVREIDALDGSMAITADETRLQFRMLNRRKGPAVWGPRVQSDAALYARAQQNVLRRNGVTVLQDEVISLIGENRHLEGVKCRQAKTIKATAIVLATGTFLGGRLFRGSEEWAGGRIRDKAAELLEKDLRRRGFHVERFKTGTPPRVKSATVDYDALQLQESDNEDYRFSFTLSQLSGMSEACYVTETNPETKEAAKRFLWASPLVSGRIEGTGPRYCPSFEDKIVKFPDRQRHHIYVEPVGYRSNIIYLNGLSTSLPAEAQIQMVRSIPGFAEAEIACFGYAVEYSCFHSSEIERTLRLSRSENLFAAGQICGTSGYEEAAALGLVAGANAARSVLEKDHVIPDRESSYIGVMIDDISKSGIDEPYRLFSSRSENRLSLRQDNADRRLYKLGLEMEVLSEPRDILQRNTAEEAIVITDLLERVKVDGDRLSQICRRPETEVENLLSISPELDNHSFTLVNSMMLDEKYRGYIVRNARRNETLKRASNVLLSNIETYHHIQEICWEAREILERERPGNLADAGRIPGVRPADIEGLLVYLNRNRSTWNTDLSRETKSK